MDAYLENLTLPLQKVLESPDLLQLLAHQQAAMAEAMRPLDEKALVLTDLLSSVRREIPPRTVA